MGFLTVVNFPKWHVDNPQEQGITIAPLNVEVWVSIRMSKKEKHITLSN
jgi:hypothetical protein